MKLDIRHDRHPIRSARVRISVELSDRGTEMLQILGDLFDTEGQSSADHLDRTEYAGKPSTVG